jgi:Glycine cleavage system T protein (aminomethyltransferase)
VRVWDTLLEAGAARGLVPAGLGARDTLRLEAGMPLYGNELDRDTTPFEAGTRALGELHEEHRFRGTARARAGQGQSAQDAGGIEDRGRGIARIGYPLYLPAAADACGRVTSGTASPTLGHAIAMGYVPAGWSTQEGTLEVGIRDQRATAQVVPLPFYRRST